MPIQAVVLDIGGVMEHIDDTMFPAPWEQRLGLGAGGFAAATGGLGGDPGVGEVTEADVRAHWQRCLGLDDATTDELMTDYWRWYVGSLDRDLLAWFASLRPRLRTGILSNSGPGAREHEACWGFEAVTDDIVYSHEVGLAKPDPAVYRLTADRLGVLAAEIVFLDDVAANVEAATAAGWNAVLHVDTARSIAAVERLVAVGRERRG